jgi:hypothetical protein
MRDRSRWCSSRTSSRTVTLPDSNNGRLIVLIGVAPTNPRESVMFRIGQETGLSAEA